MPFKLLRGRPEGTQETDQGVVHYTCNPPDLALLKSLGIGFLGGEFGIKPSEVLLIPNSLFEAEGLSKDTCGAETLLTRLGRK